MLAGLLLTNFAIVKKVEISFDSNLVLLSGETGVGKTIIVNAVAIACGGNVSQDVIRSGEESATVETSFTLSDSPRTVETLKRFSLYEGEDVVILSRTISRNRSKSIVNGHMVSQKELFEIGKTLIDLHGQHEVQSLLDTGNHIRLLDKFGGQETEEIKNKVTSAISRYKEIKRLVSELEEEDRKYKEERDFINFEIQELQDASLREGEEEELEEEEKILSNAKELTDLLNLSRGIMYNDEGISIIKQLSFLYGNLLRCVEITDKLKAPTDDIGRIQTELKEIFRDISNFQNSVIYDPERLNNIEDRLSLISKLKMKYGKSVPELITYLKELKEKVASFNTIGNNLEDLKKEESDILSFLSKEILILSNKRKEVGERFRELVIEELKDLAMENADFMVSFHYIDDADGIQIGNRRLKLFSDGIDSVEFLIKPNPGKDFKPLVSIASAGELSRVMLAIKSVIGAVDDIPVLAFDEVDAGIGGKTGEKVAEKLLEISRYRQVICVTHLPQVASLPGEHFVVEKEVKERETFLSIRKLNEYERISEVARMISGTNITETTIKQSEELLRRWR